VKRSVDAQRVQTRHAHAGKRPAEARPQRQFIELREVTDCLLDAYDCVAKRAYELFLERGARRGGELDDWLTAERELLPQLPVTIEDSNGVLYAMATIPGSMNVDLSVGLDPRWLVILARRREPMNGEREGELNPRKFSNDDPPSAATIGLRLAQVKRNGLRSLPSRHSRREAPGRAKTPSAEMMRISRDRARTACVLELPAPIDTTRSLAVLADGLLAIRMPKETSAKQGTPR
jgi:HSP20 family molecular chaperone IbpA